MAIDVELPEIARYALRRHGDGRQVRGGIDRQPVPDADLCGRRNRSRPQRHGRRQQRHRRGVPHRSLLLFRQGPDLRAVLRRSVRAQHPPAECLVLRRRRHEADERVRQEVQHPLPRRRQYGLPDGRLVPQGDQGGRRFQWPQIPHRRLCRLDDPEARRRALADRRRRHLSGAGARHH